MAKKNGFVAAMDGLNFWLKLLLALPGLDLVWGVYRIVKGISQNSVLKLVMGILWVVLGTAIFWIVDLISVIIFKKPVLFA